MDAEQIVNRRLGTPDNLAAVAKVEFQRRTFTGRHPILTFVAAPVVVVAGAMLAVVLLAIFSDWLIDVVANGSLTANDSTNAPPSALESGVVQLFNVVVRFVPFALSAWLFFRLGHQTGHRTWGIIACGLVAVAAVLFSSVINPPTAESRASWCLGLGWKIGLDQIVQAGVPLALMVRMFWQTSNCTNEIAT